ncbi:MAG: hypothetical protein U9R15_04495 [Chloroflexota bacterium]|nr:hypothetical protein [Chloroflexota bacterium]
MMKRQKWLTGILTVMLVASLLLAVVSLVVLSSARAAGGPQPEVQCPSCQGWKEHCSNCNCPYLGYCSGSCEYNWCVDNECESFVMWGCFW